MLWMGRIACLSALLLLVVANIAFAEDGVEDLKQPEEIASTTQSELNGADTAWMLVSSALVLMMTAPGLALFYGGLVRKKNILGVMMQCFFLMGIMSIVWALWGYSLAFGDRCTRSGKTHRRDRLFVSEWRDALYGVATRRWSPWKTRSPSRFTWSFN